MELKQLFIQCQFIIIYLSKSHFQFIRIFYNSRCFLHFTTFTNGFKSNLSIEGNATFTKRITYLFKMHFTMLSTCYRIGSCIFYFSMFIILYGYISIFFIVISKVPYSCNTHSISSHFLFCNTTLLVPSTTHPP